MGIDLNSLPDDIEELKRIITEQNLRNRDNEIKVKLLEEKVSLLQFRLFSKRSEKMGPVEEIQSVLFNEIEVLNDSAPELPLDEPATEVKSHKRKKRKSRRLPDDLERIPEEIPVPDSELVCGCGAAKSRIGEERSEKLDYIPAKAFVRLIIRPKYACRKCHGADDEGQAVTIAPLRPSLLGKSILAEGIFAHMIVSKFADALPFYRQETIFRRAGVEVSRKTMATTAVRVAEGLEPLRMHLLEQIKNASWIGVDETRFQVLKEPGKRPDQISFLWHILAKTRDGPIPVFIYRKDRSAKFLIDLLSGFSGSVTTDAYKSYNYLDEIPGIIHSGCNAHARRKFVEAGKVSKGNADIKAILDLYSRIYRVESDWKKSEESLERLHELRMSISGPLMEELKSHLDSLSVSVNPAGGLGRAISYTLTEWPRLTQFLSDPEIPIDNNAVENGIRPFVVGRKNWLFSDTQGGAHASALFYSLIEGAKAAGIDPSLYMSYLLRHAPYAVSENDWVGLLPINLKGKELSIN